MEKCGALKTRGREKPRECKPFCVELFGRGGKARNIYVRRGGVAWLGLAGADERNECYCDLFLVSTRGDDGETGKENE